MPEVRSDTLQVPGARLYFEVRGSGPILLLIAGGAGDAGSFGSMADFLADRYSVVTYDRRGYWRSPAVDPPEPITIATHGDDSHYLLEKLGRTGAYVLGCSIGAIIGLDLAIRHPEQVQTLVAHEPPVGRLLEESERSGTRLLELYHREGGAAAIRDFAASIGVQPQGGAMNIGLPSESARIAAYNRESFFRHDAPAVACYTLDVEGLEAASCRVVIAGGRDGREFFPYRCAERLAARLGKPIVEFPGHHSGFVNAPREFAATLQEVLNVPNDSLEPRP